LIKIEPQPGMGGDAFVMVHACRDPSGCNSVIKFDWQRGMFDLAAGQTFIPVIYGIPAQ
jgi:hypothetical protein